MSGYPHKAVMEMRADEFVTVHASVKRVQARESVSNMERQSVAAHGNPKQRKAWFKATTNWLASIEVSGPRKQFTPGVLKGKQ